jgi:Tol biopolymer transport system component
MTCGSCSDGGTPLHFATAAGHNEIVDILLAKGADNSPRKFPVMKGDYLGMKKPGLTPVIFAPDVVINVSRWSTRFTFSPDGKEIYWRFSSLHGAQAKIWLMKQENGLWMPPQIAPFADQYSDHNPFFSQDGEKLFFDSNRPGEKNRKPKRDRDIWFVEKTGKGWGEPQNLGSSVNTQKIELNVSVSKNGTLYFQGNNYEGGKGSGDIYRSKLVNGRYTKPENLGNSINSKFSDCHPCIAPDEDYIIFVSYRPPINMGLYISFRTNDCPWTKAKNMGKTISILEPKHPGISPDGKYLFFESKGYIYWVDAKIIEELKPKNLK